LLSGHETGVTSAVFAPDGRTLATADHNGVWLLWEVSSRQEVAQFGGHGGSVSGLAFTPDGRTVVTGSWDTTALLWDITRPPGGKPADRAALWDDLAGEDAARAYRVRWALAADPERAVPLLRAKLRLAVKPDAKQVRQWFADLDSAEFSVREAAGKWLEELGASVEAELRRTERETNSAEVRRRCRELLGRLGSDEDGPLAARATAVLEQAGTPEARALLETLASRSSSSAMVREAKAALGRLDRRGSR
jgi:hypothetical protein